MKQAIVVATRSFSPGMAFSLLLFASSSEEDGLPDDAARESMGQTRPSWKALRRRGTSITHLTSISSSLLHDQGTDAAARKDGFHLSSLLAHYECLRRTRIHLPTVLPIPRETQLSLFGSASEVFTSSFAWRKC